MLATLAADVPTGEGWLFEVKWDGFRAIATIRGGEVDLRSRNDKSFVERFPTVVRALERALGHPTACSTARSWRVGEDGRATFSAMQQGKEGTTYLYVAFDLLEVEGTPLIDLPLTERRKRLAELVDTRPARRPALRQLRRRPGALRRPRRSSSFEGIVAKRADSRYEPGRRSRHWLKIKTQGRQELVIAGYTKGQGRRVGRASARSCSASTRTASSAGRATSARASTTRRSSACSPALKPLRRDDLAVRRGAEDAAGAQGRRRLGRARSSSPRCASPSGRTTAGCGLRSTRDCARTRRRMRCSASGRRSRRSSGRASAC